MRFNVISIYSKLFLIILITSCVIPVYPDVSCCSESYYIDGQLTLLYKIINWWYDCLPQECNMFCGDSIKCTNEGDALINYNRSSKILKINIKYGFAGMLAVLKDCDHCTGPSYLNCTWHNLKYLEGVRPSAVTNLNQYVFYGVNKKQAQAMENMRDDLLFSVEGNIGGLSKEGSVSLHQAGSFLKNCTRKSDDKGSSFPITVKIMNAKTNEMIAQYLAIWTD